MLDNLFDLPLQIRILVYGLAIGLLAGVYVFSFHLSLSAQIEKDQNTLAQLRTEKQDLQAQVAKGDMIQDEIAETERLFNQVTAQLPEQKDIPELLRQVSNLGKDSGLEVRLFRQQPEVKKTLHAEVPVEMSVRGGYHQIALFFDKVRHLDRIVNIANMSMKNPQPQVGGRAQIESSFFATTYRFLSEDERKQIEAEQEKEKKGKK
jgi:type IV pilus assembly protein PilO